MKAIQKVLPLLARFLAAVSVTAAFSSAALAQYDATTFQTALDGGGNITLDADLTGNFTVQTGVTVILDLNGHTLDSNTNGSSTVTNNGTLTIKDSSGANAGTITTSANRAAIMNYGTLAIQSGTFTRSANAWYVVRNGDSENSPAIITAISGGVFKESTSSGTCPGSNASLFDNYGRIDLISGGYFTSPYTVMKVEETASIGKITGGTFAATGAGSCTTALNNWGNVAISGGTFTSTNGNAIDQGAWDNYDSLLTITGGTFTGGNNSLYLHLNNPATDTATATTQISGGNFDGAITLGPVGSGNAIDVSISGGKFTDPGAADYLAPGYELNASGNVIAPAAKTQGIPAVSDGALAALGLLLAGLAAVALRRNRRELSASAA